MTSSTIHLAAYGELGPALLDWDDFDGACADGRIPIVDAVLVEAAEHTTRTLHRFSTRGCARGAASVVVVGLLQPSSLVSGALAGGIGERTIATLSAGLDRLAIKQLGETMDRGPFTIVLISGASAVDELAAAVPSRNARRDWRRSIASTVVATDASTESIVEAVQFDDPLR
ncbi:MAG: hypothetical protein ABWZ99_05720 [Ilumatobacteraceae bacterium]